MNIKAKVGFLVKNFVMTAGLVLASSPAFAETPIEFKPYTGVFNVSAGKCQNSEIQPDQIFVFYESRTVSQSDDEWHGPHALLVTATKAGSKVFSWEQSQWSIYGEGYFSGENFRFDQGGLSSIWSSNAGWKSVSWTKVSDDGVVLSSDCGGRWIFCIRCELTLKRIN
jgi:hypothetical protein